jgi:hypothetical protein
MTLAGVSYKNKASEDNETSLCSLQRKMVLLRNGTTGDREVSKPSHNTG